MWNYHQVASCQYRYMICCAYVLQCMCIILYTCTYVCACLVFLDFYLQILKWSFSTPRSEFTDQLKEQMQLCVSQPLLTQLFHEDFKQHISALRTLTEVCGGPTILTYMYLHTPLYIRACTYICTHLYIHMCSMYVHIIHRPYMHALMYVHT